MQGRVPPNDVAAEKALLGILILNPTLIDDVNVLVLPDDFYQRSHQCLYEEILDFRRKESAQTLDLTSLTTFLRGEGRLEECGGASYLAELTSGDSAALSTNAVFYAKTVKNLSRRRKSIRFATKLIDDSYDISQEVQGIIDTAEGSLSDISTEGSAGASYINANRMVDLAIQDILANSQGGSKGILTGFNELDDLTGGFRPQELTIIGARPSIGKTAFALSMVLNMILKGYSVGFFSLEMSATSIGGRLVSSHSGVDFAHIRKGTLTKDELNLIYSAIDDIYQRKLFVQDTPNMGLMQLRSQARRMKQKEDVQIIFIDYIGLIEYENQKIERFQQVSYISRSLKQLCRELNIPIVCLCQVGRQAEGMEPKLSDLRDSGSIEQDADLVILLHRDTGKAKEGGRDGQAPAAPFDRNAVQKAQFILAKNRNGEIGSYEIGFRGNIVKFVNVENPRGFSAGNSANA